MGLILIITKPTLSSFILTVNLFTAIVMEFKLQFLH